MNLPYQWRATGAHYVPDRDIQAGMIWPHEHRVYRVIKVTPIPEVDWTDEERAHVMAHGPGRRAGQIPQHMTVRPIEVATSDPRARDHDLHFRIGGGQPHMYSFYRTEHWPACGKCGEPQPCREQMQDRISERAAAEWAQHETPGVCPSCSKPVTAKQATWSCPDNLIIPGGPPVTFHLRRECWWDAMRYEKRWAAASPGRRAVLSCPGVLTTHGDGTYECTEGVGCPSPAAHHDAAQSCDCCPWRAGSRNCIPAPTAANRARQELPGPGQTT